MQIDVLSQNTLKLTLSRLDMFDLDLNYESLSGKNPDTKRLLSNVLSTVKLDKSAGVDFSGERLFVEAFPRPDGGCMLYISCLTEENAPRKPEKVQTAVKSHRIQPGTIKNVGQPRRKKTLLCKFSSINELRGACAALHSQIESGRMNPESTLYADGSEYRLFVKAEDSALVSMLLREYGELISDDYETAVTAEHYKLIVSENAVQTLTAVL